MRTLVKCGLLLVVIAGCGAPPAGRPGNPGAANVPTAATTGSITFKLEAWADNWFAAYLGEQLIVEDSVSIATERSFNAESISFKADYPLQLNFILKDYKENDTGLEYIGTDRQQMGDGGFIMQITDMGTGKVVAVSGAAGRALVIHTAPLDLACVSEAQPAAGAGACQFTALAEPAGWKRSDFNDSAWPAASVHLASAVSPKDGYEQISWDSRAAFVWGPDLKTNNTVLYRLAVAAP